MRCLERSPTDRMLALAVTALLRLPPCRPRPGGGGALMEPRAAPFGSRPRLRSRCAEKQEIAWAIDGVLREQTRIAVVAGPSIQTRSFAPHVRSGLSQSASTMDRVF